VLPQGAASGAVKIGSLPTQTDVKNTWPDGSIRFAVITANVPSSQNYAITPATQNPGSTPQVWPAASVQFTIGGTTWTATLPRSSTDVWLSGPLVNEARSLVAPTAGGAPHPFLRVLFDVRSYAGGGTRIDVAAQTTLDVVGGGPLTYNVKIDIDGTTRFTRSAVAQPYLTRWRQVFLAGGLRESSVTPDMESAFKANAVPRYLPSIQHNTYEIVPDKFDILQVGTLNPFMGATGGRAEIAPYPDWTAQYLLTRVPALRDFVLKNGDLGGSWSVHITEPDGKSIISIDERPQFYFREAQNGDGPRARLPGQQVSVGLGAENAHVPSLAYVPYLLTGDRYHADEMAFWANFAMLYLPPASSDARNGSEGLLRIDQTRGIAWGLRNMVDAAAYLPDSHPFKGYFIQKVGNNLRWADRHAASHPSPTLSILEGGWSQKLVMAPWQNSYVAWSIAHANQQGLSGGLAMLDRIVRLHVLLFNSPDWPRHQAAPYYLVVADKLDDAAPAIWMPTLAAVYKATTALYGPEGGFPAFDGAYGVEARIALMLASDRGIDKAKADASLQYLMAQPGMVNYVNRRAGYAVADPSANAGPSQTGFPTPQPPSGVRVIQ
jgi:hypothetical protein